MEKKKKLFHDIQNFKDATVLRPAWHKWNMGAVSIEDKSVLFFLSNISLDIHPPKPNINCILVFF